MVEKILKFPLSSPEHIDDLSVLVQDNYQIFQRRLETAQFYKNLTDDDRDRIIDLTEKYITVRYVLRIYIILWNIYSITKKLRMHLQRFWHKKLTLKVKFWHFLLYFNFQNLVTSFEYSWFLANIFLILYPSLENSTTGIAILYVVWIFSKGPLSFSCTCFI